MMRIRNFSLPFFVFLHKIKKIIEKSLFSSFYQASETPTRKEKA